MAEWPSCGAAYGNGYTEFESRTHYEQLLDAIHRLKARNQSRRNITIVQVDAHIWNSVLGRDSGSDIRLLRVSEAGRAPLYA
jgi:hypothetical protein